jgi:hypothetical protein
MYKILQLYHRKGSGVATLPLGLRVVIGLQSLAHHAHQFHASLSKSASSGSLGGEIPRGEWDVRTSEAYPSTHSGE